MEVSGGIARIERDALLEVSNCITRVLHHRVEEPDAVFRFGRLRIRRCSFCERIQRSLSITLLDELLGLICQSRRRIGLYGRAEYKRRDTDENYLQSFAIIRAPHG